MSPQFAAPQGYGPPPGAPAFSPAAAPEPQTAHEARVRNRARAVALLAQALFLVIPVLVFEAQSGGGGAQLFWEGALLVNLVVLLIGTPAAWVALAKRAGSVPRATAEGGPAAPLTWALAIAGASLGAFLNL